MQISRKAALQRRRLVTGAAALRPARGRQRRRCDGRPRPAQSSRTRPARCRAAPTPSSEATVPTAMRAARSGGKPIDAGRDRRKRDRCETVRGGEVERRAIAGGQQLLLALAAAVPHRTDRMDHVLRRQPIAARDFGARRSRSRRASGTRRAIPVRRRDGSRRQPRRRRADVRFAALTMASTSSVVMSATQTSSRAEPTSADRSGSCIRPWPRAYHAHSACASAAQIDGALARRYRRNARRGNAARRACR